MVKKNYEKLRHNFKKMLEENLPENKPWQKHKTRREEAMTPVECLECPERLWLCGVGKERI